MFLAAYAEARRQGFARPVEVPVTPTEPMKDKLLSYLLWCLAFVGLCGIHRFYLGKWGTGIIWLLTGGLLFVGQIVDLFLIPGIANRSNRRAGYAR